MTAVTVLGLGPMGQALSAALLDASLSITVWNRTESKADTLRTRGAALAANPAEALTASDAQSHQRRRSRCGGCHAGGRGRRRGWPA